MSTNEQLQHDFRAHLQALLSGMTRSMTGMPAGPQRLLVAVEAYWELCYRRREQRSAMIARAQATDSEAALSRMSQIFERMLASELAACGAAQPHDLARSLCQEIRGIARGELLAGHRLPWQRRRLVGFLESRLGCAHVTASAA